MANNRSTEISTMPRFSSRDIDQRSTRDNSLPRDREERRAEGFTLSSKPGAHKSVNVVATVSVRGHGPEVSEKQLQGERDRPDRKEASSKSGGDPKDEPASISTEKSDTLPAASYKVMWEYEPVNIGVHVGDSIFWVHEYRLLEFDGLKSKVQHATTNRYGRKKIRLEDDPKDIESMLKVIHSTPYQPESFDITTLKSTLKLATKYLHIELRKYTIRQLELCSLAPIDRFELSRDYNITEWMPRAIGDLVHRAEPITDVESRILGYEKGTEIAVLREVAMFERGRVGGNALPPVHITAAAKSKVVFGSSQEAGPSSSLKSSSSDSKSASAPSTSGSADWKFGSPDKQNPFSFTFPRRAP